MFKSTLQSLFKSKDKQKKDAEVDADVARRAHFAAPATKAKAQTTQNRDDDMDFYVGSEQSLRRNQAEYIMAKNAKESSGEDAYDPSRYRSIHQDEFTRRDNQTIVDNDGFAFMEKPSADEEEKAMKDLDYKTKLRVLRRQADEEERVDYSQVNRHHLRAQGNINARRGVVTRHGDADGNNSGSFGEGIVSGKTYKHPDHLDVIGADRQYMDGAVGSRPSSARGSVKDDQNNALRDMLLSDRNAAMGLVDEDDLNDEDQGRRRTNAFHEYIPIDDATVKPTDLEGVVAMGGIDAQPTENFSTSMFDKFKGDVKMGGSKPKKGDSELMEFAADASAEDAVGEIRNAFGQDDEEDAAHDLVANLGAQVKRTTLAAARRANKQSVASSTSPSKEGDMEVDSGSGKDEDEDAQEARDDVGALSGQPKASRLQARPGRHTSVNVDSFRSSDLMGSSAAVNNAWTAEEADWYKQQEQHKRMARLVGKEDDEDFSLAAGDRKVSYVRARRHVMIQRKSGGAKATAVESKVKEEPARRPDDDFQQVRRERAQTLVDSSFMAPESGQFPLSAVVSRKQDKLQRPRQAKSLREIEADDKAEAELKKQTAKYKDVLDRCIEQELEKVEEDRLNMIEEELDRGAADLNDDDAQLAAEQDNMLRLDFYRQMNVLEFDESAEAKHGEDSSDETDAKNETKLEEIRRSVKRPTAGQSRLADEEHKTPQRQVQENLLLQQRKIGDRTNWKRHQKFYDTLERKDFANMDSTEMINFIDWNERRHRVDAQNILKKNTQIAKEIMEKSQLRRDVGQQHRLTPEQRLKQISQTLASQKQRAAGPKQEDIFLGVPSAIAVNDILILVGTKLGQVVMYDRETQEFYGCFTEKGKEFTDNAVSVIEVHPTRPDSVLVGYQFGQMLLFEATNYTRTIKVIKEHHKGATVANMAFLDWDRDKPLRREERLKEVKSMKEPRILRPDSGAAEATGSWMFASVDSFGRCIVTTIMKKMFMWQASRQPLPIEPLKNEGKFYSLSARFASPRHPQVNLNDFETLLAVGSNQRVLIFSVDAAKSVLLKEIPCPQYFADPWTHETRSLSGCLPSMAWGYGHTPIFKDHVYACLAVGWGPLVQTYVLLDVMEEDGAVFYDDGFVILRAERDQKGTTTRSQSVVDDAAFERVARGSLSISSTGQTLRGLNPFEQNSAYNALSESLRSAAHGQSPQSPFEMLALQIERVFFLTESVLLVLTRKLELKIFYVQKFHYGAYSADHSRPVLPDQMPDEQPQLDPEEQFARAASLFDAENAVYRSSFKIAPASQGTQIQFEDNPEVKAATVASQIDGHMFVSGLSESQFGQTYNQTLRYFNGMIVALGTKNVLQFVHLRWDEALEQYKQKLGGGKDDWMLLFARAIDIYVGKVKGFRDVPEDQYTRREMMKGELKQLITGIIKEQLQKWAIERIAKAGGPTIQPGQPSPTKVAKVEPPPEDVEYNPYGDLDNPFLDNPYATADDLPKAPEPQQPASSLLDETSAEILENLKSLGDNDTLDDGLVENYRLLMRTCIEFGVTIQDDNFLFNDLFVPFQEQRLEHIFLDELKPFIMAGRLQDWELSNDLLQNHIINYYKDPEQPAVLEKILINLNLSDCPNSVIDQLIQFCDSYALTTGLIFLHTTVLNKPHEDAHCTVLFMQLLEQYRKAMKENPGTPEQVKAIKDLSPDSIERLTAERSQRYLGYKVLWAIRLFLNGKRFPLGNIPTPRWRSYIFELVSLISNENIMPDLLFIDSAAYFQIVSILFYNGQVFEFIKEGKAQQIEMIKKQQTLVANSIISADVYEEKMAQLSHEQILSRFAKVCQTDAQSGHHVPDDIRLQYLFFVANVPAKAQIKQEPAFYFACMVELLQSAPKFVQFNKQLLRRAAGRQGRHNSQGAYHGQDEDKHLHVAENALLELMKLCEPLTTPQIEQLLELTEETTFFSHLRVELLNKKEEFVQCLMLFINSAGDYKKSRQAADRVFSFINAKLEDFQAAKRGEQGIMLQPGAALEQIKAKEEAFRKQIFEHFGSLVKVDAGQAYLMVDRWFSHEHTRFIDSLAASGTANDADAQFLYLDNMFQRYHDHINDLIHKNLLSALESIGDKEKADEYMKLQKMHFQLLCKRKPEGVLERVRLVKRGKVRMSPEECLDICESNGQVEACAILSHHMQLYLPSVTHYMSLITSHEHFNYAELLAQLVLLTRDKDAKVPIFVPYQDKVRSNLNKCIMRTAAEGAGLARLQALAKGMPGAQDLTEADLAKSWFLRFDHIIRKAIKICEKESLEKAKSASAAAQKGKGEQKEFEDIEKIWFFILDSLFKIKDEQLRIIDRLVQQKQEGLSRLQSSQNFKLGAAKQKSQQLEKTIKAYEQLRTTFEEFFKSRLDFVIEKSLNEIELRKFLDHIVQHDEEIKFIELNELIGTIFKEVEAELVVLQRANRCTQNQIIASQSDNVHLQQVGVALNQYRCFECNKQLDEEIRDAKKRRELLAQVAKKRRGTFISQNLARGANQYTFERKNSDDGFSSEDDSNNLPGADGQAIKAITLYECGHAFHRACIVRHIERRLQEDKMKQTGQHSRQMPVRATKKLIREQRCPWCYSEKVRVDFESLRQQKEQRRRAAANAEESKGGKKRFAHFGITPSSASNSEAEDDDLAFDGSGAEFAGQRRAGKARNIVSGSVVKRHMLSAQEQKLVQFDHCLQNEGVNISNFEFNMQF